MDANLHLGFDEEQRSYGVVPAILDDLGISKIALLTNNPFKVESLRKLDVDVERTVPMVIDKANPFNRGYIQTKIDR